MPNKTLKEAVNLQQQLNDELRLAEMTGEKIDRSRRHMINDVKSMLELDIKRGKIKSDELDILKKITDSSNDTKDLAQELLDIERKITKEGKTQTLMIQKANLQREIARKKTKGMMDDAKSKMSDVDGLMGGIFSRTAAFVKGPWALFLGGATAAIGSFGALDKRMRSVGDNFGALGLKSTEVKNITNEMTEEAARHGLTLDDAMNLAGQLSANMGMSSEESLRLTKTIMRMSTTMGISGDAAVGVFNTFKNIVGLSEQEALLQTKIAGTLSKQLGVNPSDVLRDIAENSEVFASASGESLGNLVASAAQARRLGSSLKGMRDSQDKILDLSTNISAVTAANVHFGMDLDLTRARQLAWAEDDLGFQKEIVKELSRQNLNQKMNRFEMELLGDALGLSLQDTKKMVNAIKEGKNPISDVSEELEEASKTAAGLKYTDAQTGAEALVNQTKVLKESIITGLMPQFDQIDEKFKGMAVGMDQLQQNHMNNLAFSNTQVLGAIGAVGLAYLSLGKIMRGIGKLGMWAGRSVMSAFGKGGGGIPKGFTGPLTKAGLPDMRTKAWKNFAKTGTKGGAKMLGKKIPIIGALIAAGYAGNRMMKGDFTGAGMEALSGIASIFPGLGTATSFGIDAALMSRDMKGDSAGMGTATSPVTTTTTGGTGGSGLPAINLAQSTIDSLSTAITQKMERLELKGKMSGHDLGLTLTGGPLTS
tara:strand:+ start:1390 stop:3513 length:2124 start_codon:yes stop_codon:yes gene_type:complete